MIITGNQIDVFRMCALRSALKLELKGLKMSKGATAYSIIKKEFGLKGNKESVYTQFCEMCEQAKQDMENTNYQPVGAMCNITWDDGEEVDGYYFSFGESSLDTDDADADHNAPDSIGVPDEHIFFYCDGERDLKALMVKGSESFIIRSYELVYQEV